MNLLSLASSINLLGFAVGVALYAMLLVMVMRHPVRAWNDGEAARKFGFDRLLLATAGLGLLWNAGGLAELIGRDFLRVPVAPVLLAAAYAALGFLPAVVVHSARRNAEKISSLRALTIAAYGLSLTAAAWQFVAAWQFDFAPATGALQILTVGYLLILGALFWFGWRQAVEQKAIWAAALAVFAVSALHLSHPHDGNDFWPAELVGHQGSLPLALAILSQNFRFAFADLFLKRALSLVLLALLCLGSYFFVALPLLPVRESLPPNAGATAVLLGLWMTTALIYPNLHRAAVWLVDKIWLRRADYDELRREINRSIQQIESIEIVLQTVTHELSRVLTANVVSEPAADWQFAPVEFRGDEARVSINTAENSAYKFVLRDFKGGRRLLSDEIEMLADVATQTARRIDALRVSRERYEQEFRAQELSKLAAESELRALRAQINPHFLFNALTTIGYLIQTAPDRALETLLQLTQLLRGNLREQSEFSSLRDELKLIESYLEIERARFEERLQIEIDAAPDLLGLRVPSLILQPLVENAVKHGISPKKNGGTVSIKINRDAQNLILTVADTGNGIANQDLQRKRRERIGLRNVEQRLQLYFDAAARLEIHSETGVGTTARITIALKAVSSSKFQVSS